MTGLLDITNPYLRRARLEPALIVVLPVALAVLSWSPDGLKSWNVLWSLFVWAGGTSLMVQVARDRGRQKEAELFSKWGGKPTTKLLRYAGNENSVLAARRRASLQRAIPDIHLPNESEESNDPGHADDVYDTCVRWLLEQTRDTKKFSLLFEENCNYGFRRNLWGMKPVGIFLCALAIVVGSSGVVIHTQRQAGVSSVSDGAIACIFALLVFWIFWCRPSWVRLPAEAYAERLLAAADSLTPVASSAKKTSPKKTP